MIVMMVEKIRHAIGRPLQFQPTWLVVAVVLFLASINGL
jgi:hypothetical protein